MYKLKKYLKDKKAANQSVEYVLYFAITVFLVLIFIDIILAFYTVYQTHVTATNVARAVSVSGGYDSIENNGVVDASELYLMAQNQLESRTNDVESIIIEITDDNEHIYTIDSDNLNGEYYVNLGDEFTVRVTSDVPFMRFGDHPFNVKVSATSSGVSEVYRK